MGMSPDQEEAWRLKQQGLTYAEIGRRMGKSAKAVEQLIRRGKRWRDTPEGIRTAITSARLDLSSATHGWSIVDAEGQIIRNSVFWRNTPQPEDFAEAVKTALLDLPARSPIAEPEVADDDLLTLYPVFDLHAGMMAWGDETGEDYDTRKACQRLVDWVSRAVDASPPSARAVILFGGDTFHADDQTNSTPRSKHVLDVDTRHFRTVDLTITAAAAAIEAAAVKHQEVEVACIGGNHDPHVYVALLMALRERYRDNPRIKVRVKPGEWYVRGFGAVMLAAHHGDKAKPEQMAHFVADEFAAIWGKTRYRHLFTGHRHHSASKDIGGVTWEQMRALSARDAYAVSRAYAARASLNAITFHRDQGERSRVRICA